MATQGAREIIECYRSLLTKNIILNDNFYRTLVVHGVFSDNLINDIKQASPSKRTEKLVELLLTRTSTGFRKFIDVLEVTGHHFLSDCLREAESYQDSYSKINFKDIEKKLPFLQKSFKSEQQKQDLERYLHDVIQKEVVKQTWKGDIQTKEQLIINRQKQIEQLWQFEEETKIREQSLQELQENYFKLQNHTDDLRRECKSLHKHIEDLDKKHMEEIKAQIDFNMANDRHLTRLNEKAGDADDVLMGLMEQLKETMGLEYHQRPAIHDYENLRNNFLKLCAKFRELAKLVDHFKEERHYLAIQVTGDPISDKKDLKPKLQEYITANENEMRTLRTAISNLEQESLMKDKKIKELEFLKDKLAQGEKLGKHYSAQLVLLQKESEENKATIIGKDNEILTLQKSLKALSDRLNSLEGSLQQSKQQEKELQDAIKAAEESKKANSDEGLDEGTIPTTPPPTQHDSKNSRNNTLPTGGNNSYLLKKQGNSGPVYVMDDQSGSAERNRGVLRSGMSDTVQFKQTPAMPKKASTTATTSYSKRLAASKAVKQAKTSGVPSTLIKSK